MALDAGVRGWVAGGYRGDRPMIWVSDSASDWDDAEMPPPEAPDSARVHFLGHDDATDVAVGHVASVIAGDLTLAPSKLLVWTRN